MKERPLQLSLVTLLVLILAVVPLVGCTPNGSEVEQLQSRIVQLEQENAALQTHNTELKEQLAKKESGQDKSEAIAGPRSGD
ncbi:septum formation initiator family protein [Chloroflexota bacterium]